MQHPALKTLFAEFQEAVFKRFAFELDLKKEWTFTGKKLKGKKYWYQQRYVESKIIQKYYAPSDVKTDEIVMVHRKNLAEKRVLLKNLLRQELKIAAMLKRGGLPHLDHLTALVIEALARILLIYKNGVLIGSYAFSAYAGVLGTTFDHQSLKTFDIDVALETSFETVSHAPIKIENLLKKIDPHFRAVPDFSHKYPPSSFIGSHHLRIDLLTPLRGKQRGVIKIKNIPDAAAIPLRFLDFLTTDPIDAVLIGPKGGIPVTIPHPARFAIHKLIVATRRSVTETAKRSKDILQAEQLILICCKEFPYELKSAYNESIKQGKKWKMALEKGVEKLTETTQKNLKEVLS